MNLSDHAYNVVASFKASLTPEQIQSIGDESFEDLQILVEAAIGSTASKAIHDIAKEIETLAKHTRNQATLISKLEE